MTQVAETPHVADVVGEFHMTHVCIAWGEGLTFRYEEIELRSVVSGSDFRGFKEQLEYETRDVLANRNRLTVEMSVGSTVLGIRLHYIPESYGIRPVCDMIANVARLELNASVDFIDIPQQV